MLALLPLKRSFLTLAIAVVSSSCSTLYSVDSGIKTPSEEGNSTPSTFIKDKPLSVAVAAPCEFRNLTLPWVSRNSRCYRSSHDGVSTAERRRLLADYLSVINAEAETTVIPAAVPVPDQSVNVVADSVQRPLRDSASYARVVFAPDIFVLGPNGRARTQALADRVGEAHKVTLRGLFLPGEILVDSDLYREKLSVARSLAVRKFWADNGVDVSNVVILHHAPDLFGRHVVVNFL